MIKEFTSLKGLLAIAVFAHHAQLYRGGGTLAVCIFFLLSGFLSTLGYYDKISTGKYNYKEYLIKRGFKYYPLHWLLLLASLPLLFLRKEPLFPYLSAFCLNASLLQSFIPIERIYFSFNSVSWYLSDTVFSAVLFPFLLKAIIHSSRRAMISIAVIAISLYFILWIVLPNEYTHAIFYINPIVRLFDFFAGIFCGVGYLYLNKSSKVLDFVKNNSTMLRVISVILILALFLISCLDDQIVFHSIIYLPFACLLVLIIALNRGGVLQWKLFQWFGSISFAFYMSHVLVIRYLWMIFAKFNIDKSFVIPIAFVLTTVISYFLTIMFNQFTKICLKKV